MRDSSPFQQLIAAAATQSTPQLLLFVFAGAELPEDATPQQRTAFESGHGGELTPLMCTEKKLAELSSFDALAAESRRAGPPWQVMFAAGLGGRGSELPSAAEVESALTTMVERVRSGAVGGLMALSNQGEVLDFA